MVIVKMPNKIIHVSTVSHIAAIPFAHSDLLVAKVVVGGHARMMR
jgi:hypothetical protein